MWKFYLMSELVCKLRHFTDGSARPSPNTFGSLGCVPRSLQQVQADWQRVERGQPRLHGTLHLEQGRQQKDRQKCEFAQNCIKISTRTDLGWIRWSSQENFRVEQWNAEILLKALLPPLQGSYTDPLKRYWEKNALKGISKICRKRNIENVPYKKYWKNVL